MIGDCRQYKYCQQYLQRMGNICNGHHDKQQQNQTVDTLNKNFAVAQFLIKNICTVQIVLGTYRCQRGQNLLVMVQQQYLQYASQLRDYAFNFTNVLETVNSERKKLLTVAVNRSCPYKKIQLCILSPYKSDDAESYIQQFKNIIEQIIRSSNDITLQINHTAEKTNGLPNQTLLAIFFKYVIEHASKPFRMTIVSNEAKLLNLVRYEIVKLEDYILMTPSDKHRN